MIVGIALITGASAGIGMEFARQLAAAGEVEGFWLVARREERLKALAEELSCPCTLIAADLSTEEGLSTLKAALEEQKPAISWCIPAAGYGLFGDFTQVPEKDVVGMVDLNVKAAVLTTYMTIPYMPAGGHIVELGSGSCFTPLPNFNIYASSKAFIMHFSKALRFEVKSRGLSVTVFCPGWVATEFLGKALPDGVNGPKEMKPLLLVEPVVRRAIRAARKGRFFCVTNWYTKAQQLVSKLLPDVILTKTWLTMQR